MLVDAHSRFHDAAASILDRGAITHNKLDEVSRFCLVSEFKVGRLHLANLQHEEELNSPSLRKFVQRVRAAKNPSIALVMGMATSTTYDRNSSISAVLRQSVPAL